MIKLLYIGNFLSNKGDNPPPAEILLSGLQGEFEIHKASSLKQPIFRLLQMLSMVIWGKLNGARVMLLDVFSSKAFWYAFATAELARTLRLPIILILHGGELPKRFKSSSKASRRLLSHAAAIVSPSGYLKQHAQEIYGKSVEVIGNPLQLKQYPFLEKQYSGIHLLWVRAFHEIYHPEMAIEVCKELSKGWPGVQLTMIGPDKDGSMSKVQQLARASGLGSQVYIRGQMSKGAWIQESQMANVFINTTRADNTPVSVLEALALGLPLVSTNVGGIPHLLQQEETALLVNEGDSKAMSQAIQRIMTEPELREKLIQQGRALAEQMELKEIAQQWEDLIKQVVSTQP